jgi:hypothetical protein
MSLNELGLTQTDITSVEVVSNAQESSSDLESPEENLSDD